MEAAINALSTVSNAAVTARNNGNNGVDYKITLGPKDEVLMVCNSSSLTGAMAACTVSESTKGTTAASATEVATAIEEILIVPGVTVNITTPKAHTILPKTTCEIQRCHHAKHKNALRIALGASFMQDFAHKLST